MHHKNIKFLGHSFGKAAFSQKHASGNVEEKRNFLFTVAIVIKIS
jgi:hypothetical protein